MATRGEEYKDSEGKKVKSKMQKYRTGNKDGEMEERIGDREGGRMNRDWCQ